MSEGDWIALSIGVAQCLILAGTGIFIGLQVRLAKEQQVLLVAIERSKRATEFIARWNSPELDDVRHKAVIALRSGKPGGDHHPVLAYLNFFWDMALQIEARLADDAICMAFFRSPLHHYWTVVEPYLLDDNNTHYDRVKLLDSRWQVADPKPVLEKIRSSLGPE